MASYLPQREADLGNWVANFSTLISGSPGTYGLVAGDATAIAAYVSAFTSALAVVNNPATKTKATVAAKDAAKAAMLDIVRPYAIQVRNNAGVSNADKTALGLTIVDQTLTNVPAPSSSVLLNVIAATPGEHEVRFADSNSPTRRSKPLGTIGLQLFVAVAAGSVNDPAVAPFRAFVTRQPYAVSFEPTDNGKIATYFARWQNAKGETGPWSNAISFTVVA